MLRERRANLALLQFAGMWLLVDRGCRRRRFPLTLANRPAGTQIGNSKHCKNYE
jgi:hypothetical protein